MRQSLSPEGRVGSTVAQRGAMDQGPTWKSALSAVVWIGLVSCSDQPSKAPSDTAAPTAASGEMGEPHDQSAFGKDPSETHLKSPDEPDLHPQPEPAPPKPR